MFFPVTVMTHVIELKGQLITPVCNMETSFHADLTLVLHLPNTSDMKLDWPSYIYLTPGLRYTHLEKWNYENAQNIGNRARKCICKGSWKISETCAEINPSRTRNNAICIFCCVRILFFSYQATPPPINYYAACIALWDASDLSNNILTIL